MITREAIERRLAELRDELDKAVARVNALGGAIQDCEYWLEQEQDDGEAA